MPVARVTEPSAIPRVDNSDSASIAILEIKIP